MNEHLSSITAVVSILLNRMTDASHMTIEEVATYRQVTRRTVSNWLAEGKLTKQIIPGTARVGIPTREVHCGWLDANAAAELLDRQRNRT